MFTEKGAVKPAVRKVVVDYVDSHRDVFANAEKSGKGYSVEVVDSEGNVAYVNFDVTVSAKPIADRAPRATRKSNANAETFEIE